MGPIYKHRILLTTHIDWNPSFCLFFEDNRTMCQQMLFGLICLAALKHIEVVCASTSFFIRSDLAFGLICVMEKTLQVV